MAWLGMAAGKGQAHGFLKQRAGVDRTVGGKFGCRARSQGEGKAASASARIVQDCGSRSGWPLAGRYSTRGVQVVVITGERPMSRRPSVETKVSRQPHLLTLLHVTA